jgi:hypothetical protein
MLARQGFVELVKVQLDHRRANPQTDEKTDRLHPAVKSTTTIPAASRNDATSDFAVARIPGIDASRPDEAQRYVSRLLDALGLTSPPARP